MILVGCHWSKQNNFSWMVRVRLQDKSGILTFTFRALKQHKLHYEVFYVCTYEFHQLDLICDLFNQTDFVFFFFCKRNRLWFNFGKVRQQRFCFFVPNNVGSYTVHWFLARFLYSSVFVRRETNSTNGSSFGLKSHIKVIFKISVSKYLFLSLISDWHNLQLSGAGIFLKQTETQKITYKQIIKAQSSDMCCCWIKFLPSYIKLKTLTKLILLSAGFEVGSHGYFIGVVQLHKCAYILLHFPLAL